MQDNDIENKKLNYPTPEQYRSHLDLEYDRMGYHYESELEMKMHDAFELQCAAEAVLTDYVLCCGGALEVRHLTDLFVEFSWLKGVVCGVRTFVLGASMLEYSPK